MTARAYLKRQFAHTGLGLMMAWAMVTVVFFLAGEFPYRAHTFAGLVGLYIVLRGYFGERCGFLEVEDAMFVLLYGVGGTLLAFKEVIPGSDHLIWSATGPAPVVIAFIAHLAFGAAFRVLKNA